MNTLKDSTDLFMRNAQIMGFILLPVEQFRREIYGCM